MSYATNYVVQDELPENSDIGTDRSSILGIEMGMGVDEKTVETCDVSSISEEILGECSDDHEACFVNDNSDQQLIELRLPDLQYSREVLLQLKELPMSNIFPMCLEKSPKSILAHHLLNKDHNNERKPNETSTEDDKNSNDKRKQFKKKNAATEKEDAVMGKKHLNVQDRLRKEEEIVLSPQRRSFNTGCSGSFNLLQSRNFTTRHRLDSLTNKDIRDSDLTNEHRKQRTDSLVSSRETRDFSQLSNNRRINRGRLMSRDSMWERDSDSNMNYGFDKRSVNNSGGDRRLNSDVGNDRDRYGFFGNDRKRNYNDDHPRIEKEPEWFSAGPTSQYDVIELQGFDDSRNDMHSKKHNKKSDTNLKKKELSGNAKIKTKESLSVDSSKSNETKNTTQKKIAEQSIPKKNIVEKPVEVSKCDTETEVKPVSVENQSEHTKNTSVSPSFSEDLADAFLNFSNLLGDDTNENPEKGTSKFSRWFKSEPDDRPILDCPLKEKSANVFVDSQIYTRNEATDYSQFDIPISSAPGSNSQVGSKWPVMKEVTGNSQAEQSTICQSTALERMLKVSSSVPPPNISVNKDFQDFDRVGKIHSVEELEAHIRKPQKSKKDEDMTAFRMLFNQSTTPVPNNPLLANSANPANISFNSSQPSNINMSNLQQQQHKVSVVDLDQIAGSRQADFTATVPDSGVQLQISQNELLRMNMLKQQALKPKDMNMTVGVAIPPNSSFFPTSSAVESQSFQRSVPENNLQLPDAQVLLYRLKNGQITVAQLFEQLQKNHSLQPKYREVLNAVIQFWVRQPESGELQTSTQRQGPLSISAPHAQQFGMAQSNDRFRQQMQIPPPLQPENISQLGVPIQNTFQQRIPSPQELMIHTQSIMQSALIKKKLEEQRENYKRRQESKSHADEPASSTSPNVLSTFTPTSVLRHQKRKSDREPVSGCGDHVFRHINAHEAQQQMQMQQQRSSEIFTANKGRPIIKKSVDTPFSLQAVETPYHVHSGHAAQLRSQTPAPNAAQIFLSGFGHDRSAHTIESHQQQHAHVSGRNSSNLASATACLQGLLLDNNSSFARNMSSTQRQNTSAPDPTRTSNHLGFNRQPVDNGGPLSRWFPTKLIEDGLAGKLPDIPKTQNMLSVEDLERVQTVHN